MSDLARLAVAALGGQGETSGVIGVDVQRIRRTLELRQQSSQREPSEEELDRENLRRFESYLRRELERALIHRTESLRPRSRSPSTTVHCRAGRFRTSLRSTASLPSSSAASRPRDTSSGGGKRSQVVDMRRTMRASLETGGVPLRLRYRPKRPRRPEIYVLCDVSTSVTSASVFFLSVLHALHDAFRKLRSFAFVERIDEVTEIFDRERSFQAVSQKIAREAGVADVSGYTDYGRVWMEFLERVSDDLDPRSTVIVLGDARTNGREPHAPIFGRIAAQAGADVLAQPRATALLELRRLGDGRLRALLRRRLRVLDDQAARAVRERDRRQPRAGLGELEPPRRSAHCNLAAERERRDELDAVTAPEPTRVVPARGPPPREQAHVLVGRRHELGAVDGLQR